MGTGVRETGSALRYLNVTRELEVPQQCGEHPFLLGLFEGAALPVGAT